MITKDTIEEVLNGLEATDLSSTKLYVEALDTYKECVSYTSITRSLKEMVSEVAEGLNKPKAFVNRVNNIIVLAQKTTEFKLHTMDGKSKNIKLYFYNIEKAVNLMNYLREHKTEEVLTTAKNKLNKVKKVADKRKYNDEYDKVLRELYKEHKVALSVDGDIIKVEMTKQGLDKLVKDLDDDLKAYLKSIL